MEGKIRVVIVDDSALVREILQVVLSLDNDIEVVGHAKNGKEAIDLASKLRPDVITMDISMPEMDGIDAIEHIMAYHPTPIMVLTSLSDAGMAFRSLSKGALEVVEKPELDDDKCREFVTKIKQLSKVQVITHISGRLKSRKRNPVAESPQREETLKKGIRPGRGIETEKKVVAIGSSTGGPKVLGHILGSLPADISSGILIVQHISDGFVGTLVDWLDDISEIRIKEAEDGETVLSGVAYIAPARLHLAVSDGRISLDNSATVEGQRPSADFLFSSVAREYGPGSIGVILSGMGRDGALGIREIRDAGGFTIAQDEKSCVVFGMPKVAIELGGVQEVLPPESIPAEVLRQLSAQESLSHSSSQVVRVLHYNLCARCVHLFGSSIRQFKPKMSF